MLGRIPSGSGPGRQGLPITPDWSGAAQGHWDSPSPGHQAPPGDKALCRSMGRMRGWGICTMMGTAKGRAPSTASAQSSCHDWSLTLVTTSPRGFCSFSWVPPGRRLDGNCVKGYVHTHLVCLCIVHVSSTAMCVWVCTCIHLRSFHATGLSLMFLCITAATHCW